MPTMDQVAWAEVNVQVGDGLENFKRSAVLPEPATDGELAYRRTLRLLGAIRVVEVVYTPEELAAAAAPPPAEAGEPAAGPPTVTVGGATPVVVGDEDLKAEHEHAARARRAGKTADDKA